MTNITRSYDPNSSCVLNNQYPYNNKRLFFQNCLNEWLICDTLFLWIATSLQNSISNVIWAMADAFWIMSKTGLSLTTALYYNNLCKMTQTVIFVRLAVTHSGMGAFELCWMEVKRFPSL